MINRDLSESKRVKENSGITLIALVVTIVVLIILATVSINAVLGQNGIIGKAKQAKESYEKSVKAEDTAMQKLLNEMAEYDTNGGGSGGGSDTPTKPVAGTTVTKPGTWTSSQVTPIADGNGGTVPLPSGFYYVGGDYDTGLVISDKQNDTMDASGTDMGNQFVWIPVSGEADLTRTAFDTTTGQPTTGLETDFTEPYAKGYSTEAEEYNTMKTQVLKYGGFYIGRFETGVNSTTLRTKVTTNQAVVCKKGVAPYNYVPWGKDMDDVNTAFAPSYYNSDKVNTNGAVYLAKNFASQHNYTSVTSTLTYGCEWDAMCRYIGDDSQRTDSTKDAPELTGSVEDDVSKNIYDLAGNCSEWTMEADYTSYRVSRGGNYDDAKPVSYRISSYPDYPFGGSYSFRPTLYIK